MQKMNLNDLIIPDKKLAKLKKKIWLTESANVLMSPPIPTYMRERELFILKHSKEEIMEEFKKKPEYWAKYIKYFLKE